MTGESKGVLVSVVIPAYNCVGTLRSAIDSVLSQSYPDLEVIVVDDGSEDDTRVLAGSFGSRVRVLATAHAERSAARNRGVAVSRGEWVAFLDADDEWLPGKVQAQMSSVASSSQAVLVFGPAKYMDSNGRDTTHAGSPVCGSCDTGELRDHRFDLLYGNTVTAGGSTALVRRSALDSVSGFDESMNHAEDIDLWYRLAALGPFLCVPEVLVRYRVYGWQRELQARASRGNLQQQVHRLQKARAEGVWPEAVVDKAEAHLHAFSAVAAFHIGEPALASEMLVRAGTLDSDLKAPEQVTTLFESHARRMRRAGETTTSIVAFLRTAIGGLPEGFEPPRRGAEGVMARLEMAEAFRAHRDHQGPAVRKHLAAAVAHDPAWLRYRAVWSMWWRSRRS